MQTVKTTIVVVLLLTVTYSAYVALTAPPADLPEELADLVESGDEDFLSGDDILLGNDIDVGEIGAATDAVGMPSTNPELPPPLGATEDAGADAGETGTRSADLPAFPEDPNSLAGMGSEMPAAGGPTDDPDNAANRLGSPSALPTPGEDEQRIEADPQRQYPSTDDPPLDLDAIAAETSGAEATGDAPLDDLAAQADRIALANAIATADRQRQQDRLREALATLSLFYNVPGLAEEERAALLGRIDWLAGEVIYSRRHLLEQPYRVSQGESLAAIAAKLQVPAQLLATVNGLQPGDPVVPGSELKVIRGPFRAEVNLERDELTLFLGELYAGRFPIVEGTDPVPQPGSYEVREKRTDRNYYAAGGQVIPADDPRNPYGQYWIDLGSRLSIHATGAQAAGPEQSCIQLRTADARDVFGILSAGSDVSIVR